MTANMTSSLAQIIARSCPLDWGKSSACFKVSTNPAQDLLPAVQNFAISTAAIGRNADVACQFLRLKVSASLILYLLPAKPSRRGPSLILGRFLPAIDRAEQKRQELLINEPAAKQSSEMISILPKATKEYRRQIADGLDEDPKAVGNVRVILRKLLGRMICVWDRTRALGRSMKCALPPC